MKEILSNKWFKFAVAGLIYLLWVLWIESYLWLIGLAVIFDIIPLTANKPKWLNG